MLTGWRLALSKLFIIPQRYVIAIMSFFCMAVAYTLRVSLNIAITQMVTRTYKNHTIDWEACPEIEEEVGITRLQDNSEGQFEWSEYNQGVILSSFFYGYVITHIPAGLLAEKYGAKYTMGFGILITALLTIATPAIVRSGGSSALITIRIIEGLGEGPTSPALAALMARWIPKEERGRLGSLIFGGAQIGNIFGNFLSGLVMSKRGDWPKVFYMFGGIGLIFVVAWMLLVYSDPKDHPFISDEEREYLATAIGEKSNKPVPWRALLTSVPLWAIVIAGIGHDWGYFTIVTDLPKYFVNVLKLDVMKTGFYLSLSYVVMWLSAFAFGSICDCCIKNNILSTAGARKTFTTIASMGPALFIIAASYVGCNTTAAVAMFTLGMMSMGAYYCGMKVNPLDIAPNYAGTTTALVNGIAALSGFFTPYLVGVLAPQQTQKQWRVVLWIVFGVFAFTNIIYIAFAKGEEQWWNNIEKNGYPENWKRGEENVKVVFEKKDEGQKKEYSVTFK